MEMFEGYSMFSYREQDNMKVTAHFYTKYQYSVKFDPETKLHGYHGFCQKIPWLLQLLLLIEQNNIQNRTVIVAALILSNVVWFREWFIAFIQQLKAIN